MTKKEPVTRRTDDVILQTINYYDFGRLRTHWNLFVRCYNVGFPYRYIEARSLYKVEIGINKNIQVHIHIYAT